MLTVVVHPPLSPLCTAYRTIACVYVIVMFLVENDDPNTLYQFFQYLTHWGARMIVTYYITSVVALIWLRCNKR